jgi:hypothetical protein
MVTFTPASRPDLHRPCPWSWYIATTRSKSPRPARKKVVRGQRPGADPVRAHGEQRGSDLRLLLAAAEEAVLARMRVDPADRDARARDPGTDERFVPAADGALHQRRLDPLDGVEDPEMRGHVDDAHLRGHEHHRDFRSVRERGQELGVSGIAMAAGVQGLLVQRRGAHRGDLPGQRQLDGPCDVLVGGVARRGG